MALPPPLCGGEELKNRRMPKAEPPLDRPMRMMFGTAMLMGSSYPFAKDVLAVMSPLLYSASRYLVASPLPVRHDGADAPADGAAAARLGADDPAVADRRLPVPGLLGPRHGAERALARLDRHDHDDGLLGHPGLARRTPAAGAGLGRHRHRLRRRGAGGQQLAHGASRSRSAASTARCSGCSSAFAWALYVDRCAPYNLRLGRSAGHGLDHPDRLPGAAADLARLRFARRSSPGSTTGCWASGSTPRSSPWAWPSWASAPASTGWG